MESKNQMLKAAEQVQCQPERGADPREEGGLLPLLTTGAPQRLKTMRGNPARHPTSEAEACQPGSPAQTVPGPLHRLPRCPPPDTSLPLSQASNAIFFILHVWVLACQYVCIPHV